MDGKTYHVYIMASRSRTLYTGITSNLRQRVHQHKTGAYSGFSKQYRCHRLVWSEAFSNPHFAIIREKELKGWRRDKKLTLIQTTNPTWLDLSEGL
jgi:putative endonuclease